MRIRQSALGLAGALAALSPLAYGGITPFANFTPLTATVAAGSLPESAPFELAQSPFKFVQQSLANRANQSLLHPGSNSGNWDMITANQTGPEAGRYLFMPFETGQGGVQRVDLKDSNYDTRTVTIVAPGTQGFVSGDASRWTPWGSYLTAEESWGSGSTKGRLFEVTNAVSAAANAGNFVQRTIIPRVSHEGLAFDKQNALYFVDELNGGSLYKFVSNNPQATNGDDYFASGQTFVLKVGAGGQFEGTSNPAITGAATWVPITDTTGKALPGVSVVLADGTIDGRATAKAVGATGYNRPEDMEIKTLADGTQQIYFTTTDSDDDGNPANGRGRIYSVDLAKTKVQMAASNATIDKATGAAVGSVWRNPDNLAIDADGNIYIVEDQDGGLADIWFMFDSDDDGVAESVGRWASLSTLGAEPTGLYFDPFNPTIAYVNVQHPASGDDHLIMISAVPEPGGLSLAILGLGIMGGAIRRR